MDWTEIPLGLPGKLFRCAMPFGAYDRDGVLLQRILDYGVDTVVLLATDAECLEKAGLDLRARYAAEGLEVLHLPIEDFSVPQRADLEATLAEMQARLRQGQAAAVHCSAGIGRTGLVLASLAGQVLGLDGPAAVRWTRQYVHGAAETFEQRDLVAKSLAHER